MHNVKGTDTLMEEKIFRVWCEYFGRTGMWQVWSFSLMTGLDQSSGWRQWVICSEQNVPRACEGENSFQLLQRKFLFQRSSNVTTRGKSLSSAAVTFRQLVLGRSALVWRRVCRPLLIGLFSDRVEAGLLIKTGRDSAKAAQTWQLKRFRLLLFPVGDTQSDTPLSSSPISFFNYIGQNKKSKNIFFSQKCLIKLLKEPWWKNMLLFDLGANLN